MKTITLSNWERFWLTAIVGSGSAPTMAQIRLGNKALDVLEMTDEEKTEVGWQPIALGQFTWQKERDWELSFDDDVWQLVQFYATQFQRWPQDPRGRRTEALYDKIMEEG